RRGARTARRGRTRRAIARVAPDARLGALDGCWRARQAYVAGTITVNDFPQRASPAVRPPARVVLWRLPPVESARPTEEELVMPERVGVRPAVFATLVCLMLAPSNAVARRRGPGRQPTSSSPITLLRSDRFLASVNPDAGTVSIFRVQKDRNEKTAEVSV